MSFHSRSSARFSRRDSFTAARSESRAFARATRPDPEPFAHELLFSPFPDAAAAAVYFFFLPPPPPPRLFPS